MTELLVCIGIIAALIAILLPVLSAARRSARDVACLANVREWGRSFQMYVDANRGRAFAAPASLTDEPWFELLRPFNADTSRTLLCAAATEPGNMVGSASMAWGPVRTYSIGAPTFERRGEFVGSYGFNGWLWRVPGGSGMPPDVQARAIVLPAPRAAAVPVFADAILDHGMPLDTDTVPASLENPLPRSGPGVVGPRGSMSYFCIDRHRRAVNVVFLDGHAERVTLERLWTLQWNRAFQPQDVTIPR